jgi:hypothetical protein
MKRVKFPHTEIEVNLPSLDFFIDILKRGNKFHFIRINHGILDEMIRYFSMDEIKTRDQNYISEKLYEKGFSHGFSYHGKSSTIKDKVESFIRVLFEKNSESLILSISPDIGLDYVWGRMPAKLNGKHNTLQKSRFELVDYLTTIKNFSHSGILKHFSFTGEIIEFFNFLNEESFTVVFLGPQYFRHFEKSFHVEDFVHIVTPPRGAIDDYDFYANQIIEMSRDRKIFLFYATGHISSAYLYEKFVDESFSFFDIGRSFDWSIKEFLDGEVTAPKRGHCWARICGKKRLREYIEKLRNG